MIKTQRNHEIRAWAVKLPFDRGLFFCWNGRDSYGSVRSWSWTKYDYLDHLDDGFERRFEIFPEGV